MRTKHNQDGITLLVTLLLMGVLMSVGASLLNITLMQYQLSNIALSSEMAFQAANAGVECALYKDLPKDQVTNPSPFEVPGDGSQQATQPQITCMGNVTSLSDDSSNGAYVDLDTTNGKSINGGEQNFRFDWGINGSPVCTDVSVYKFYSTSGVVPILVGGIPMRPSDLNCIQGETCTVIQSRGYNVACGQITTGAKVVEREFTQVY